MQYIDLKCGHQITAKWKSGKRCAAAVTPKGPSERSCELPISVLHEGKSYAY